jgi:hypothetical protein
MQTNKDEIFRDILKNLREENLAIFAGAGMSLDSGYVNWSDLLRPIANELELNIEKEFDLVALAQYHCNEFLSRSKINQILIDEFSQNVTSSKKHDILARLPINTYWTTNYDKLIEKTIETSGKVPDIKYTNSHLSYTKPNRDVVIYKMHGDVEHPESAIITRDDYESYHRKMEPFFTALAGDLVSKTFLFIGFSFTDPNLDYILGRVRQTYGKDRRRHYCFIRKVKKKENEDNAEYDYRIKKQHLFIKDLRRFNIISILIDEYLEIENFLEELEKTYRRDCVFISGAAHEYGKWDRNDAERFVYRLSKAIIANDFKIVSGFGLGIGSMVISGALEEIYGNLVKHSKDDLILKPFPQKVYGDLGKSEMWYNYRNDMISYAGVAIFLFGNKFEDDKVIKSNGMREEFIIAKEKGLFLLPIGITGYISEDFQNEIQSNFNEFYPDINQILETKLRNLYQNNNIENVDEIISNIIDILKIIRNPF